MNRRAPLVTSPGKFQGEPEYVPMLWDDVLSGWAEDVDLVDGSTGVAVILNEGHFEDRPSLALDGWTVGDRVILREREDGFVELLWFGEAFIAE